MEFNDCNEAVQYIQNIAAILSDENRMFEEINTLSPQKIDELLQDENQHLTFGERNEIGPGRLLRKLLLEEVKKGNSVDGNTAKELSDRIVAKDKSLLIEYNLDPNEYIYKESASVIKSWSIAKIFDIYFKTKEFDYASELIQKEILKNFPPDLLRRNISNGMLHSHNGQRVYRLILYPKAIERFSSCYSLSLIIDKSNIHYSIQPGRKLSEPDPELNISGKSTNFSDAIDFFITNKAKFIKGNDVLMTNTITYKDDSNLPATKPQNLNTILFGPPGTGKTYSTVNKALEICGIETSGSREEDKARFQELVNKGQVVFTTFHQSTSYEDFIEGIKPVLAGEDGKEAKELQYELVDGILKRTAVKASYAILKDSKKEAVA